MELDNGLVMGDTLLRDDVLARIIAFTRTCPEEQSVKYSYTVWSVNRRRRVCVDRSRWVRVQTYGSVCGLCQDHSSRLCIPTKC